MQIPTTRPSGTLCLLMVLLYLLSTSQSFPNGPNLPRVVTNDNTIEMENLIRGASSTKKDELSYDTIQNIIDVSRPYYALENECVVRVDGKIIGIAAEVSQEMPFSKEEGGHMGFAEAMRHMAIVGSIAAALANPRKSKNYYLALNGSMQHNEVLPKTIQDEIDNLIPCTTGKARIFAYSTDFNKREATSEIFLSSRELNSFIRSNVSYKILAQTVYSRFFPRIESIDQSALGPWCPVKHKNPYIDPVDIPISDSKILDHDTFTYRAKIPVVCPTKCFGHFDTSPCLPVAFLLAHLVDAAMQSVVVLCKENGASTKPLIAKKGFLDAESLVQAGTHGLNVKGKATRIDNGIYEFAFDVIADNDIGRKIAHFKVTFAEED